MSRAQRTGGWAKRPRARVLVFLFLVANSLLPLTTSICTSLVVPPAATHPSSSGCLSLYTLFLVLFLLFILWLGWVYGIFGFFPFLFSLTPSRDLAQ